MAYLALFLWSFLAATFFPVGSEPALIGLSRTDAPLWLIISIATIGNFLGACFTYWLGGRAVRFVEKRRNKPLAQSHAGMLLRRYGHFALVLSWVPVLGDAIVVLAGGAKMAFLPFSFWVISGKAARYSAVIWIANRLFI